MSQSDLNCVVIGTVDFTLRMLEVVHHSAAEVVGVVTSCDESINSDYVDLEPFCESQQIPVLKTDDINDRSTVAWVAKKAPDVIFCLGWSRLLQAPIINIPRFGVIGYHPAALPKNRGRHPIIWALALGLTETASTFFAICEGADTGDIVSQKRVLIHAEDDASSLYVKLSDVAAEQLLGLIEGLQLGVINRIPQDLEAGNSWRKRTAADGAIDWRMSAHSIHNLVRALSPPYVGAHFDYRGMEIKVWRSRVGIDAGDVNSEPGKVLEVTDSCLRVKCGCGTIDLISIMPCVDISEGEYL